MPHPPEIDRDLVRGILRELLDEMFGGLAGAVEPAPAAVADAPDMPDASSEPSPPDLSRAEFERGVLSERLLDGFARDGVERLSVGRKVVVTPLAREAARKRNISIERNDK